MVSLPTAKYPDAASQVRFYDEVLARLRALPGVEAAGFTQSLPFSGNNSQGSYAVDGLVIGDGQANPHGMQRYVDEQYFDAMSIRLLQGRTFTAADGSDSSLVVIIDRLLAPLEFYAGAVPVLPASDTLARADGELGEGVDRTGLVRVQTPQAFRTDVLKGCYDRWSGPSPTDEATVVRAAGHRVAAVEGDPALEKITTAADFRRAEDWLASRLIPRTGMGFDVHGFAGEGPIMLGGVAIPHARGLAGHSDADVVLHAITDAILGAAGLGDIGMHFPPSEDQWKGASSDLFLAHSAELVRQRGGIIDHVDCTVIAEEPKVGPYRDAMRSRIAGLLQLREDQVSIKATTTEGLGFAGRREGIAAQAVASIRLGTF